MVGGFILYGVLLFGAAIALLGGLLGLADTFETYRDTVAIRDTPLSDLHAAAVGPVAVTGTVECAAPLARPVGEGHCVAYDLMVRDVGVSTTATHIETTEAVEFVVSDGVHRARVTADEVTFDVSDDRSLSHEFESYEDPPAVVGSFQRRWGLPTLAMGGKRSIEQSWLEPGDEVYLHGRAVYDESGSATARAIVAGDRPVVLSDKSAEQLTRERRYSLGRSVVKQTLLATAGLAVLLWATPLRALF